MPKRKIFIASDHAGYILKDKLKSYLIRQRFNVIDCGPDHYDPPDDYPDFAIRVCEKVLSEQGRGILICGSGLGMSRVANKIPGIYADVCWSEQSAKLSREHGNTNVLCLGAQMVSEKLAQKIALLWLGTRFSRANRHLRRINKIKNLENTYLQRKPEVLHKATLAFLINGKKILLAMKKRGFGQGKLNGIGGKVKKGETIEAAMIRETMEEIGVKPLLYRRQAVLKFFFPYSPADKNWNQKVYVYLIDRWQGQPRESLEMKPQWVGQEKIPYHQMWSDDPYWLPYVLQGKKVKAEFAFDPHSQVEHKNVSVLK